MKSCSTRSVSKLLPRREFHWRGGAAARFLAKIAVVGAGAMLLGHSARAAGGNTVFNVINGNTDLAASGTYTNATTPTAVSDVTFTNAAYSPAAFTLSSSFTLGSLNDARSGTNLSISNTSGSAQTITLGGAGDLGNSVSGVSSDLLYVTNGGNLTITGGSGASALGLVLGQTGNFDTQGNGSLTISSVISDGGSGYGITKTGSGTLTLQAANTYTEPTTISQGTLSMSYNATTSVTTSFINSASALVMGGYNTVSGGGGISANVPTLAIEGLNNTAETQTFNGFTVNPGTDKIVARAVGSGSITVGLGAITHNPGGSVDFTSTTNGGSGVGKFTTSTGNVNGILGGWAVINNTPSSQNAGVTVVPTDYAYNDGTGNIIAYTGYNTTLATGGTIASDGTQNYKVTPGATMALSTANAATTDLNTFMVGSTTGAFGTTITVGAAGNGSAGILRMGANGGFFTASTNGSALLTIGNTTGNGTLTAGGAANTAGEITFQANQLITVNSNIADNGTGKVALTFNAYSTPNSNTSVGLFGANTYSGGTFINSGRVNGGTATAFGTGAVTVAAGAQAILAAGGGTYANDFNISGGGGGTGGFDTPSALRLTGQTLTGKITLLSDAYILPGGTNTMSGQITGGYNLYWGRAGGGGAGAGTITLSNVGTASNYTGNTTITEGTVKLGASNQIPDGASAGNLLLSGAIGAGTFDLNSFSDTINGLTGVANATVKNGVAGTSVLTVGANNATATYLGTISNTSGTLGITKVGTGTQTLSGTNSYGGATTVNGGALKLTSSLTGAGAVNVNGGGTLNTSGTAISLGGATTVAGGSTSATQGTITQLGNSLTTDVLTLSNAGGLTIGGTTGNSSNLGFDVLFSGGTASADKLAITNAFTVNAGGGNVLINSLGGIAAGQTYNLINFGSGSTYNGSAFTTGSGTTVDGLTLANTNLSFGVTGALNVTGTAVQLVTSGAVAPNTAYWQGSQGTTWASLNAGGTAANFTTDQAGTNFLTTYPASNTDVIFAATNATNLTNTLGQNFDIKGLEFLGTGPTATTATNISGANTLSTEADGITLDGGNAGVTLGMTNLGLGQSQSYTNNSSSALTINSGTAIASNATSGTTTLTLSNTGTGTTTINGSIGNGTGTNAVALVVNNTGTGAGATTTLSGTNTYTGGTTVSAGTLDTSNIAGVGSNVAASTVSIAGGATMDFDGGQNFTENYTFGGAGRLLFNFGVAGGSDSTVANFNNFTGTIEVANGAGQGNKLQISSSIPTALSSATLQIDNGAQYFTGGNVNFGAINIIGNGNSEGRGAIRLNGNGTTTGVIGGSVVLQGSTTIGNEGGTLTGNISSGVASTQTLTMGTGNSNGAALLSGVLSDGSGTLALNQSNGTTTLSGANTYGGGTTISGGTLKLTGAGTLGAASGGLVDSGTLDLGATSQTVANLTGSGTVLNNSGAGTGTLTFGGDNASQTFNGTVKDNTIAGGSVAVVKVGTGVEQFSGTLSNTGGFTVGSGVAYLITTGTNPGAGALTFGTAGAANNTALVFSNNARTFANAITTQGTGGTNTIQSQGGGQGFTFSGGVALSNNLTLRTVGGSDSLNETGAVTGTGNLETNVSITSVNSATGATGGGGTITLSGSVNNSGTITNDGAGSAATFINGVIGSNVTGVIENSATSALYLNGTNTYGVNGGLTVTNGAVYATNSGSDWLTDAAGDGTVTLGATGAANTALIQVSNLGRTFANAITTQGTVGTNTIQTSGGGQTFTFSGPITDNGGLTLNTINGSDSINATGAITGTGNLTTTVGTGAGAITISGGSVNNVGTITNNGVGTNATTISGNIGSNVTNVVQNSGTSSLTLSGTDAAGTTTVSAGTLNLSHTGGAAVVGTSVIVSGDGTFQGSVQGAGSPNVAATGTATDGVLSLGAVNQLSSTTAVTLIGGTIEMNGKSQGTTSPGGPGTQVTTFGAGTLTVGGNGISYLDFGAGNTGAVINFNGYNFGSTGTLYIENYNDGTFEGSYNAAAGGGTDQLFFGSNGQYLDQQLLNVYFVNPSVNNSIASATGLYQAHLLSTGEVVAPEPSQWVSLGLGMLGLGGRAIKARKRKAVRTCA